MQFKHIKSLSESVAEDTVTDCLITLPNFFGYKERKSIVQSAEIAGFNILGLVNENVGAAIEYSWGKTFSNQNIIIYNIGSTFTQLTLINYSTITEKLISEDKTLERNKINIVSEASSNVGGRDFDINLVNHLKKLLEITPQRKGKTDSEVINAKLLRTSINLKEVLSSKKEAMIEFLGKGDIELQQRMSRETFEDINHEVFKKIINPVELLLKINNLTITNIHQIELIGGSTRITRVQELLKQEYGNDKIGLQLNSDEAVVMGSALLGANYKSLLKAGKFEIKHGLNFEFIIELINDEDKSKKCGNKGEKTETCFKKLNKKILLFKVRDGFNISKTISLAYSNDFKVLLYERLESESKPNHIMTYILKVKEMLSLEKINPSNSKVYLKFKLDQKGLITLKVI